MRQGDRQLAHGLCLKLVEAEPGNEQAWLWYARTAETPEETAAGLSQALLLNPGNQSARQALAMAMQALLQQDAFLAYVGETSHAYRVRTATNFHFSLPKDRSPVEPFPPGLPPPAQRAFRWLGWSLLGLIPAGLGALVCTPVTMLLALRLLRRPSSRADRRRALVIATGAAAAWLLAVFLFVLVMAHL